MSLHFKALRFRKSGDTTTPIGLYANVREAFTESIFWETHDSSSGSGGLSCIAFDPIARFSVINGSLRVQYPDSPPREIFLTEETSILSQLREFLNDFSVNESDKKPSLSGLYGHINYDAVKYFEDIKLGAFTQKSKLIPDVNLVFYRNVIFYHHQKQELELIEHLRKGESSGADSIMENIVKRPSLSPEYPFEITGEEHSNFSDDEFLNLVDKGKSHCLRGDVFQIVLSRAFARPYRGDDFQVFRKLRRINPSPYHFYFDFGNYRLMGCSPEVQLRITGSKASIHPIAGTYRRSEDEEENRKLGIALQNDPKENAEHTMLIDLARNDLSKKYKKVILNKVKEIQHFSHVVHMTSEVTGEDKIEESDSLNIIADTFPAGTLSGAPKYKAMQLIDRYENQSRGFYGGSIGFLGFNGDFDHAIMIRSILSKNNILHYQAGAGIVADSVSEKEREEVNHKLKAVRAAINMIDN